MKLISISEFEKKELKPKIINESFDMDEVQTLINYSIENKIPFTVIIDDFSELEIGKIVKMIGDNLVYSS
jgi:hypothetical protein